MDTRPQRDPLLTPQQAAGQLGIKLTTLEVWRSSARYQLEYVKVGKLVRYRQSAIERFINDRTVRPGP